MRSDYFIALVPDGTPYDSVAHRRRDLDPDEVFITSTEGAGRTLITIVTDRNDPGLQAMLETSWCHVSRVLADGSLFHVGQGWIDPISLQAQDEDLVSVEVMCSPRDWDEAVAATLAPLKVLPGYEPLLIPAERRDDPVEILDGYSKLVFCHPSTHAMSVVDIFGVGLPVIEIADPDWPGPQPDATTRPPSRVDVILSAEWIETRSGQFSIGNVVEGEFPEDRASTLTPDAFESAFPRQDSTINGDSGYVVKRSVLTRREDLDPELFPATAGPVRGSSGVYNYVTDPNLTSPEPQELELERVWYDLELDIAWSIKQRRVQTVRFSIINGAPSAIGGPATTLELKTEDISIDDTTPEYLPGENVAVGTVRRVGSTNWKATVEHVCAATFSADLYVSLGGGLGYSTRWSREPVNGSALGNAGSISYFHTPRGRQTIEAAALKARAILAASIRNRPYRFETELTDDLLGLTVGHVVRVACPDQPGGWLQAKVGEIEISSNADDETMAITIMPAAGSGTVVAGADPLTQTGEAWDRLFLGSIDDQQPVALNNPGGTVRVDNTVAEQLAYVQANDYSPADGRADEKLNDPVELLKAVPTTVVLQLTQLAGRDAIEQDIELPVAAPWSGPRQYGD